MRLGKNLAGRVDLGWPMNAYDSATVVTCVLQGNRLTTRIRRVDERAGSTPGTDLVDVVAVDDPPTTRRELLAVPPGGPAWATLERTGARLRVLDPEGAVRAEIDATARGLTVRAFDEQGAQLAPQPYLMV